MVQAAARTQRKEQILDLQSSWRKSHLNWPLRGRQVGFFFFNQRIILQCRVGFSCTTMSVSCARAHTPSLPPLWVITERGAALPVLCSSFPLAARFTHAGAHLSVLRSQFIPLSLSLAVSSSLFSTCGQVLLFVALVLTFTSREQPTEQRVRDEQSRRP